MIVNPRTFKMKPERYADAVALAKESAEAYPAPHDLRIYIPMVAPFHTMAFETEFDSLAQYERIEAEFWTTPKGAALLDQWRGCFTGGGTHEFWELVE